MRPQSDVALVLALLDDGLTTLEISRRIAIPRSTVRDWAAGHTPQRQSDSGCPERHLASLDREAYAYLLGMYLGDGCISNHPRGVFRLRIMLDAIYPDIAAECAAAMEAVTRQAIAFALAT